MPALGKPRTALVISQSPLERDPRVRRQIEWLASVGWTVDSLGLGGRPTDVMREHFEMGPEPSWVRSPIGRGLAHLLLPYRRRFEVLSRSRIPDALEDRIRSGGYDLVIFNDIHLIAWLQTGVFDDLPGTRIHLDLHEYHLPHLDPAMRGARLVDPYHRWARSMIGSPRITSRSTVVPGIADLYRSEFDVPPLSIIRNCPPFVQQAPSEVDDERIELLYHGIAAWERGLDRLVDAMTLLDDRFALTLMLTGSPAVIDELRARIAPLGERVRIVPPVPMEAIATAINPYDIEVMFYPPATPNLRFALPNKLFEAVQGRLALAVGDSPAMAEIVREYGNGVVAASGWTDRDLADALNGLETAEVRRMKAASVRAAADLNAEHEKQAFLAAVDVAREETS